MLLIIVIIDSVTYSFCLRHCVQNSLSYTGKETQPTLCKKTPSVQRWPQTSRTNKDQLLHRIQSIKTITNLQYN